MSEEQLLSAVPGKMSPVPMACPALSQQGGDEMDTTTWALLSRAAFDFSSKEQQFHLLISAYDFP